MTPDGSFPGINLSHVWHCVHTVHCTLPYLVLADSLVPGLTLCYCFQAGRTEGYICCCQQELCQ